MLLSKTVSARTHGLTVLHMKNNQHTHTRTHTLTQEMQQWNRHMGRIQRSINRTHTHIHQTRGPTNQLLYWNILPIVYIIVHFRVLKRFVYTYGDNAHACIHNIIIIKMNTQTFTKHTFIHNNHKSKPTHTSSNNTKNQQQKIPRSVSLLTAKPAAQNQKNEQLACARVSSPLMHTHSHTFDFWHIKNSYSFWSDRVKIKNNSKQHLTQISTQHLF